MQELRLAQGLIMVKEEKAWGGMRKVHEWEKFGTINCSRKAERSCSV